MIDQATIARILDAANIVDVVKDFVTLRKAGVNYKGLCPFHEEKTPSFVVSPSKQLCKCFSCGKGGNVVHFIMEHEQMTYPEALRWLAKRYGIEIQEKELTPEERAKATERESLFILNEWARDYFINILHNDVDGVAIGKAYFRSRGFRDDIIRKFQLGFSPQSRDAMSHAALRRGFKEDFLLKTGLSYRTREGRLQDRYHGRVIFPVHTISGKVVAFGGRILTSDKTIAKYVNSPESEIYSKSHELYGLYFAKSAIVKQGRCYLVEGYTDVISMHQSGIENVVASSGTSLTPGQIRLIHRFTENITVLYDGDSAGIKASLRGIDMLLSEGMNVSVLLLPDGDDPDSFARKHNAEEYRRYIEEHQVDFIRFKVNLLLADCKNDPLRKAELIQSVVQSIAAIPRPIPRQMYITECASMLDVDEALLMHELQQQIKTIRANQKNYTEGQPAGQGSNASTPNAGSSEQTDSKSPNDNTGSNAEDTTNTATSNAIEKSIVHDSVGAEEGLLVEALIRYADLPIPLNFTAENEASDAPEEYTVAQYIQSELTTDGLQLPSAMGRSILNEATSLPLDRNGRSLTHFLAHPDPEISRTAAQMGEDPYVLCQSQQTGYVPERQRLGELIPRLVHDFKNAVLNRELQSLLRQLRDPAVMSNPQEYREIMQHYKELYEVQKAFARYLGERVVNAGMRKS